MGAAFFISAGECAFGNQLVHSLERLAPEVNPTTVLSTLDAANLRASFSEVTLTAVRQSYLEGLRTTYALAIASAGTALLVSLAAEWKKVNMEQVMKNQGPGSDEDDAGKSHDLPGGVDPEKRPEATNL